MTHRRLVSSIFCLLSLAALVSCKRDSPAVAPTPEDRAPPRPLVWRSQSIQARARQDARAANDQDKRVERALEYLSAAQNLDGSWDGNIGYKMPRVTEYSVVGTAPHVGVTALAGLAFLSNGYCIDKGRHSSTIRRARDFVLSCVNESGFIARSDTRMHSHAIAGIFLTEAYRQSKSVETENALREAAVLTIAGQSPDGGWGYFPFHDYPDLICTALVFHFSRNLDRCGLNCDALFSLQDTSLERASVYLNSLFEDEKRGYVYCQTWKGERMTGYRTTFSTNAAALSCLIDQDGTSSQQVEMAATTMAALLSKEMRDVGGRWPVDLKFFMGCLFVSVYEAKRKADSGQGLSRRIREKILEMQKPDGSWSDDVGVNYATAMAVLILNVPKKKLLLFQ